MDADEQLRRLAEEGGITPRYWDISGTLHETTSETMRALLGALGIPAESAGDVGASLARFAEEAWSNALPPVSVVRENENISVPLRLPTQSQAKTVRWSVHLEDGRTHADKSDLSALPVEQVGQSRGVQIGLRHLHLPPLPAGYHHLTIESADETPCLLIVAPARCYLPEALTTSRRWGIAAQLYGLKTKDDWGIGDLGGLRTLIDLASARGADAIGLNPLHALFLDAPEQISPYSPSSRLFHNPLYIDVPAVVDFAESVEARTLAQTPEVGRGLSAARSAELIVHKTVAAAKVSVLRHMHRSFQTRHLAAGTARGRSFQNFQSQSGEALEKFATFQMLSEHFGTHDWRQWPDEYRDPASPAISRLRQRKASEVSFFSYLQWLCDDQLSQAADEASRRDMLIGLYNDLAISVDAAGADHWAHRDLFADRLRVGAPPDPFNEQGQEWGVVPLNPRRLTATRYEHFIALLRANMRHAGALRIDHVIGWQRLFLIRAGEPASHGAYVRFPLEDLLGIAALESWRNRCVLIGEDLGTVPDGFRERMAGANVLSCRIFYFERRGEQFRRPEEYPVLASVSAATHDLATLRGYFLGDDISAKARLGAFKTEEDMARARAARAADMRAILQALANEGLLPGGVSLEDVGHSAWTLRLAVAIHAFLARTPSMLLMAQLDDLAGELHQANLPGSTSQYPNWQRRLSQSLVQLRDEPSFCEQVEAIALNRVDGGPQ